MKWVDETIPYSTDPQTFFFIFNISEIEGHHTISGMSAFSRQLFSFLGAQDNAVPHLDGVLEVRR